MKISSFAPVLLVASALAAQAAGPGKPPQACAAHGIDHCAWNGTTCTLDVDSVDPSQSNPCDFGPSSATPETDHLPLCISVSKGEHIVFKSGGNRAFRVRRLVPMQAGCPADPFNHSFDPAADFGGPIDSDVAKAGAANCQYKLELQYKDIDASGKSPKDPHDGQKHECHDPHLQVVNP